MACRIVSLVALVLVVASVGCKRSNPPETTPIPRPLPAPVPPTTSASSAPPEHSVIAHLRLSGRRFGTDADVADCQALELALDDDIAAADAGVMDGNEIGDGECTLFMYGADADKLFDAVSRRLRASRLARGGWVVKRYGSVDDPKAREVRINL
jgi:hypothetical protein